ncbi:HNH endonuclease [uncultured Shewanella sp.]|uniref:HNH endonuclease n=1 Tax=uncultured Shewanella sp. TaxID=173975 RepID=UPI0026242662|nr:HNH endonuclease [uncultured Shewanella sp.]
MPAYETKKINTSLHQSVNFKPLTKQKSSQHLGQKVTKGPGHSIAQLQITAAADQNSAVAHSTAQMQDNLIQGVGFLGSRPEAVTQRKGIANNHFSELNSPATMKQAIQQKTMAHINGCGCSSCLKTTQLKSKFLNQSTSLFTQPLQFTRNNREEFTKQQKVAILKKNKAKKANGGFHTCVHCGFQHALVNYATLSGRRTGDGGFQIDHIKPASSGGRAIAKNAQVLCGTCNTSKGNRKVITSTGMKKYKGCHRGSSVKNYLVKRKGK